MEKGDYDQSIATCEKAIEAARELRADFKLVAKCYGRIGSCYLKKEDYNNAIKFFNKSLTEHRTPEILNKLRDTESESESATTTAHVVSGRLTETEKPTPRKMRTFPPHAP